MNGSPADREKLAILYHLGRMTWPDLPLSQAEFEHQVRRSLEVGGIRQGEPLTIGSWMQRLRLRDWWLSAACLQREDPYCREKAWTRLMAGTVPVTGRLLTESLMEKARQVYGRDEEARERSVSGFWGLLLAGSGETGRGPLHRYDGTSPLIPWILTVYHNHLVDETRKRPREHGEIPRETAQQERLELPDSVARRFVESAERWLSSLSEAEVYTLSLVWCHGLTQRQVAEVLGKHESNVSRDLRRMRDSFRAMTAELTDGDEVAGDLEQDEVWQACLIREMGQVLAQDARLGAIQPAKSVPAAGNGGL